MFLQCFTSHGNPFTKPVGDMILFKMKHHCIFNWQADDDGNNAANLVFVLAAYLGQLSYLRLSTTQGLASGHTLEFRPGVDGGLWGRFGLKELCKHRN